MARCACGGDTTCACLVVAAPNSGIEVTGRGTSSDPYEIGLYTGLPGFSVQDTDTVDLSLLGGVGENESPVLSAVATLAMTDLTDVDGTDLPATGDIPTWDGTQWVFSPAAAAGPPVSGVWGTPPLDRSGNDPLAGRTTYVDTAGQIRSAPLELNATQGATFDGNSAPTAWPVGSLILQVTIAAGATWPGVAAGGTGSGTVYTLRRPGDTPTSPVVHQWFYASTAVPANQRILYRSAAGDPSVWSPWRDLTTGGGTFGERNYASSRGHAAATSIPNAAITVIALDTLVYEDGIVWNDPLSPGAQFRIPVDGYYQIDAVVTYVGGNAAGARTAYIYKNATAETTVQVAPTTGASNISVPISETLRCAAGDYITLRTQQSSGGPLALVGAAAWVGMSITKVPAPVVNGAAASGVWGVGNLSEAFYGVDSLNGQRIYVDANGQLRSVPVITGPKAAADLPATYPVGIVSSGTTGSGSGFPGTGSGLVSTNRRGNDSAPLASQHFVDTDGRSFTRYGTTAWQPWGGAPPRTLRRKSTSQALTVAGTWYTVTYDADEGNGTGIAYAGGVFTAPEAGTYQINVLGLFGGASGATIRQRIIAAGNGVGEQVQVSGGNDALTQSRSVRLAAGETVYVEAQASLVGVSVTGSATKYTMIDITRISA